MPLPYNFEAEAHVIGTVLAFNELFPQAEHVRPEHFHEPLHGRIWERMHAALTAGRVVNGVTLQSALRDDPALSDLSKAAGAPYMAVLMDRCADGRSLTAYIETVLDDWGRRQIVMAAHQALGLTLSPVPRPALEVASYLKSVIHDVENNTAVGAHELQNAPQVAERVVAKMAEGRQSGRSPSAKTGLRCIDRRIGGLHPGSLIVLGGRPSAGKTALARAIAHGCAVRNPDTAVIFYGIEMGPDEMMQRELSALSTEDGTGIEYRDMGDGNIDMFDMERLETIKARVPPNLSLVDCPELWLADIRRSVWAKRQKGRIALVVIDYLQIMKREESRTKNEAVILGEITAGLKRLARQAKCAILLLSQLSRKVEERDDKRPMMSDLRESGSIEQDADVVLLVYRESYYLERSPPPKGCSDTVRARYDERMAEAFNKLEVICAKARRASVGFDFQTYRPEYDSITD